MELKNPDLFKQYCYINGQWVSAHNGATFEVFNPFDNNSIGQVPQMGQAETTQAILAAKQAFPEWQAKTAQQRAEILVRWANLIAENIDDLAMIMTLEQGKPLKESATEIAYANSFNYWFAEEGKRIYGDVIPTISNDRRLLVIKQPVGVCAAITPWNFPSAMIARKCAPALAAGCTVVIKPAESTPYSALALMVLAEQAGFPAGVLNMVTGDPQAIGLELCTNPLVSKLSFTGSTQVGKLLMRQCSDTVKKLSLELGGNAPMIIFPDADMDAAIEAIKSAKFRNGGQTCVSANRIYVHETIFDSFIEKLRAYIATLVVGNGLQPEVNIGPLINEAALKKVTRLVNDAVSKGATVLCGGKPHPCSPNAYEPTLITNTPEQAEITQEEIFGPVAAIYRFKNEEEVIAQANHTPYGLASYFFSQDIVRVWRVAEKLEYGMVSINTGLFSTEVAPFGGVKESGFGREGSKYGIEDFVNIKYLCVGGIFS